MKKPRKRTPLTPDQVADAARLKAIFLRVKAERARTGGEKVTQAAMSDACGWDTQSAASQYMNGDIALNVPAVLKASAYLGVMPRDISPTLSDQITAGLRADLSGSELAAADLKQLAEVLRWVADRLAKHA